MRINNIEIKKCDSLFDKFKGLMFQKNFNYGIRLRCNGIHTFFMKENIDVILTDQKNKILHIIKDLKPNKIILPKKNIYYTYELPTGNIKNLKINDYIK